MSDLQDVLAMLKKQAMSTPSPEGVVPVHANIALDGDTSPDTHIVYITDCVYCKGDTGISMLRVHWDAWQAGAYVQHVWPTASLDSRETLINGTHSDCFDVLFKEEDEGHE